jgi:hypothetical protein
VGLGVRVRYADIDNGIGAAGKKSMKEEISAVAITLSRVGVGDTLDWWLVFQF